MIVLKFVKEDFTPRASRDHFLRNLVPDFSILGHSRELMTLVLVVGLVQMANSVLVPVLPLFIRSLSPATALIGSTAGIIIGMRAFAGTAAAAFIGRTCDRFGTRRILLICLIGGALSHLPLLIVQTPWQLLLLRFASGVFLGGTIPSVNALIASRSEHGSQGSVFGISSSFSAGGSATGPMVGAGIAALWGFNSVFLAATVVLSTAATLIITTVSQKKIR